MVAAEPSIVIVHQRSQHGSGNCLRYCMFSLVFVWLGLPVSMQYSAA